MPLPQPEPGLVIHYEYLWRDEHLAAREHGSKRRPCVIIAAVATEHGRIETVVAPITHREPMPPASGVVIPITVKRHLGLDEERAWVVATDLNVFEWPGVDLHPVPRSLPGTFHYGFLPPRLFGKITAAISAAAGVIVSTRRSV